LIDFQLDAQNSYLFICNTFIKILYMRSMFVELTVGYSKTEVLTEKRVLVSFFPLQIRNLWWEKMALELVI